MNDKYYLGIDLGSDSIGWAVTDEEYNFLRLKGKTAWGSRIFSEASDKKARRSFRANRRRIARRKYRIQLLNELFAEEINKVDKTFFLRLDNSTYLLEDKQQKGIEKNLVFKTYEEEKKFYKDYPTIWALRKAQIEDDPKSFDDIRKIYLSIHHIIKYRGNFLHDGEMNYSKFDYELLDKINNCFKETCLPLESGEEVELDFITSEKGDEFTNIITDNKKGKSEKQKAIKALFNTEHCKNYIDMFASIVTGGTFSLSKIDKQLESKIDFSSSTYEDNIPNISQELGDAFELVLIAKEIYDFVSLNDLLKDKSNISDVMNDIYLEHKNDLKKLKTIIISVDKKKGLAGNDRMYYKLFKDKKANKNYASLVQCESDENRADRDQFLNFVKEILVANKEYIDEDDYNYFICKIDNRTLLRTIANISTSVIPHQLHENELLKIVDNGCKYYPFLKDIKEKLKQLFEFRVPYYFGPLNDKSEFSNAVRKSNERVTPWNFDEIFDNNKTRAKFIRKLTNSCSYLPSEKVLPKASLYYERYVILDKLNALMVNGNKLSLENKHSLYEYILSNKKTMFKSLCKKISSITGIPENDVIISGIKEDDPFVAPSNSSLNYCFDLDKDIDLVEDLIFLATIYADDKKSFKKIISDEYKLNIEQKKAILNLQTSKWARFSKKLLCELVSKDENDNPVTILYLLENTDKNFQMIINDPVYKYIEIIDEYNKEASGNASISKQINDILESSPAIMKRSINQALLIIDDIIKANKGKEPDKIFLESTRENDDKKKGKEKDSRYKELDGFIKALVKDANSEYIQNVKKIQNELSLFDDEKKNIDSNQRRLEKTKLKSKHIYLYFKQMGLDAYTGKPINLDDVLNSNKYDIDHIVPQSLIKDDSLDNLVLVDRNYNQNIKKAHYPIPEEIRLNPTITRLWKYLRDKNLISKDKYVRLTRTSEMSLDEIQGFVARQINIVNYSNVALRDILKLKYKNTNIVFSKAQYPHFIREEYDIVKCRELNDAHHAVDAYLNVVAGNILSTAYSNVSVIYARRKENEEYASFNMENTIKNKLKQCDANGELLSSKVKNNCLRHDALVTYKLDYNEGALYKQTIFKASGDSKSLIPIHSKDGNPMNDTSKYGGYSSLSQSHIMAIQYEEKGKIHKVLYRVPIMYIKECGNDKEMLVTKVLDNPNVNNVKLIKEIHLNQKIKCDGCIYLLYTANENQNKYKMAYQNYISNECLSYLKKANKYLELLNNDDERQSFITNRDEKTFEITKDKNIKIFNELMININKKLYDSCNYIVSARNIKDNDFINLSLKDQIITINNMIILLSRNSENGKLPIAFEGVSSNFKLLKTNDITNQNISLIIESPTGLYSHEVLL